MPIDVRDGRVLLSALLLLPACGSDVSGGPGTAAQLPLKRGFYVTRDTPCEAASNATLVLVREGGINGARESCDFVAIEQTGPQRYRVTRRCADLQAGADDTSEHVATLDVPDEVTFTSRSDSGEESQFRRCEQASLPDPWRDNDIGDLAGAPGRKQLQNTESQA
jgi:hypothetical protein